jgi:predicted O-methyltransferase YrrM
VIDSFRYFPDQRAIVERNLASSGIDPASVDFRESTSSTALRLALQKRESFSFILIDADHNADHVMHDLRWTRLLEEGGYVCLHDYQPAFPGVMWATDRFLRKNRSYRRVALIDTLAVVRKERLADRPEVTAVDLALARAVRPFQRLRLSLRRRFVPRWRPRKAPAKERFSGSLLP